MSEPRTAAGRRVLGILQRLDAATPSISKAAPIEWRNPILAIEHEAAALGGELSDAWSDALRAAEEAGASLSLETHHWTGRGPYTAEAYRNAAVVAQAHADTPAGALRAIATQLRAQQ